MRKRTVKILTGITILIVVLALTYAIALAVSAMRLQRAYAALRSDGRPMTLAQVVPPEVLDSENAALLYESAALLLRAQPAPKGNLLGYLGDMVQTAGQRPPDPNRQSEIDDLLGKDVVDLAVSIVEQGTRRPVSCIENDYDAGLAMPLSHLSDVRAMARILGARAYLQAREGRTQDAWQTAMVQLKHADILRAEPVVVSQFVRSGQIALGCTTVQELCVLAPPDQEISRTIQDLLRQYDDLTPLIRAVDGERLIFGEQTFALPKDELRKVLNDIQGDDDIPAIVARLRFLGVSFKPLFLADHAAYLRTMREYADRFTEPWDANDTEATNKEFSQIRKYHALTSILLPNMGRVKEVYLRGIAQIRITRTGLALLQYRNTHGDLPETLGPLAPESVHDPFSQRSLVYKPLGTGFDLYSVGPDQKDNGGAARKSRQKTDYDIVWHFPDR